MQELVGSKWSEEMGLILSGIANSTWIILNIYPLIINSPNWKFTLVTTEQNVALGIERSRYFLLSEKTATFLNLCINDFSPSAPQRFTLCPYFYLWTFMENF